jgi:two-component system chemotaxis response regulator CheB
VVGVAASAGGPGALAELLPALAGLAAPVLVVQHLHPFFVEDFRHWMSRVSALPVEIALQHARLVPGRVYIAQAGTHLRLGPGRTVLLDEEPRRLHMPSADELFLSMAVLAGQAGIGVVLTGLGDDGAIGLRALRVAGGETLVQDPGSSAVPGMPAAAERLDAAGRTLPLPRIAAAIQEAVRARTR